MPRNPLQIVCLLMTGILLAGCNSEPVEPGQTTQNTPTANTLAGVLHNQRIHFEIKDGDTTETAWFQVGDDNLVAWGKENHYSLTNFGQKDLSIFVVNGSKCIEVRFREVGAQVGDTITLLEHSLGKRDLDDLLKSVNDAEADNVRIGSIVKTEKKEL